MGGRQRGTDAPSGAGRERARRRSTLLARLIMLPALELELTTLSGEQTMRFSLSKQYTIMGRELANDICINEARISRKHATIELRHGHVFIHDHSSNGTWLNGVLLVSGGRGSVLRYNDVRVRLP